MSKRITGAISRRKIFSVAGLAPDDGHPDDYVFRVHGKDVGHCYLMVAGDSRLVWRWTVYNAPYGGMEDTLEEAQRQFKQAYEGLECAPGSAAAHDRRSNHHHAR